RDDVPEDRISGDLDLRFHLELAKATQNPLLDRMMNTVQETIHSTLHLTRALWMTASAGTVCQLFEQHEAIFIAVRDSDHMAARRIMYDHLSVIVPILSNPPDGIISAAQADKND
ncbi:MAG: FCD domain-containing protein, partial [Gracilibacteraceae bacterium]|nr:FCD domain-containing protein [Gracilibacteraceae bacterium]